MTARFGKTLIVISLIGVSVSCSKFQRAMKSPDAKVRYRAAVAYYEKKDYYRAGQLLEDILPILSGSAESENANLMYAYCHYHQEQYMLAAHYFKSFASTYGRSPFAEEALYMRAYCLYKNTPDYNLDQSGTDEAIDAFQDFISRYGNETKNDEKSGQFLEKATQYMAELRLKLETKSIEIARQYIKLQRYKAAITALENFIKDFPDSEFVDEADYLAILSRYELAQKSLEHLKEQRFREVITQYNIFADKHTESKYMRSAETVYANARKSLDDILAKKSP